VDMTFTWAIISVFVIGFMGVLCYALAVLNRDLDEKQELKRRKSVKRTE